MGGCRTIYLVTRRGWFDRSGDIVRSPAEYLRSGGCVSRGNGFVRSFGAQGTGRECNSADEVASAALGAVRDWMFGSLARELPVPCRVSAVRSDLIGSAWSMP